MRPDKHLKDLELLKISTDDGQNGFVWQFHLASTTRKQPVYMKHFTWGNIAY